MKKTRCIVWFAEIGQWINKNVDFAVQYVMGDIILTLKVKGTVIFKHTFHLNAGDRGESLAEFRRK